PRHPPSPRVRQHLMRTPGASILFPRRSCSLSNHAENQGALLMFAIWWKHIVGKLINRKHTERRGRRRRGRLSTYRVYFEPLEERFAPAAHTWSGAAGTAWSNPGNWSAGGAPVAGETAVTLTFPAVTNKAAQDDISGLSVDQIKFTANGYTISGNGTASLALS